VGEHKRAEDQSCPGAAVLVQNVAVCGAFFVRLFVPQEEPKTIHQRVEEALDCNVRERGGSSRVQSCLTTLSCRIAPLCVISSPLVRCLIVSSQTEEGTSSTTPPAYEDTWFVFSFFSQAFPLHLLTAFFSFIHIPPRVALLVLLTRHTSPPHHASPTISPVSPLVTPQSRHLSHVPPSLRAAPCHTSPIATRHPFAKQVLQKCNTIHCALPHL
jgi:hypothetical protein